MKGQVTIIKANGETETHQYDGNRPSLKDFQKWVGGYIEIIPGFRRYQGKPAVAFANEEGKLKDLPVNEAATKLWGQAFGRPILSDVLVGDVVICQGDEAWMDSL